MSELASSPFTASQVTLVDATPLTIDFDAQSVTNATLYSSRGCPAYRLVTNNAGTKTDIFDLTGSETRIATIKRRELLPDVIKYRNRATVNDVVKINKWLKDDKVSDGMAGASFEASCGQMTWTYGTNQPHRLSLYKSKDLSTPVAFLDNRTPNVPLRLVIDNRHQDLAEEILIGALILEHKLIILEGMKKHDLLYGSLLGSSIHL